MDKIILVGAGGHAKSVVDTLEKAKLFEIVGFVDKEEIGKNIYRAYKIIGHDEELEALYRSGVKHAFVCVGYMGKSSVRAHLYCELKRIGYKLPVIIDDTAIIASDVQTDEGTYIGKGAVLNSAVHIGKMCIINTSAIVEHEAVVGDFSHISVGAVLCGQTEIADNVLVGANSTVIQNIQVGKESIIGAGSVVTKDIGSRAIAVGVPARVINAMKEQL